MRCLPVLLFLIPLTVATPIKRYSGVRIQAARDGLCLSVAGNFADGTAVVSQTCEGATLWDINPGSGSVLVHASPGFALDAGSNPGNNGALKIWTSYPGLYQQTWYLTGDKRIAITGGNQCLDEGTNGIQTYQCTTGNTNQIFNIITPGGGSSSSTPSSTSSSGPSSTSSTTPSQTGVSPSIPSGTVYPDPPNGGRRLHPYGRPDLCVSVTQASASVGQPVQITYCFANSDPNSAYQLWDLPAAGGGLLRLHSNTGLCLDAGLSPSNGSGPIKVWTCYQGLLQQTWNFSGNNLKLPNNQCLDVTRDSTGQTQSPYSYLETLQNWQCSTNGDPQQIFFLYG